MPFPFTKLPRGLTSALGVREMGQLPRVIADDVRFSIPALEAFLFNDREPQAGAGAVLTVAAQTFTSSLVPAGECWFLWAAQVSVTTTVGEAASFTPMLRIGGVNIAAGPPMTIGASTTGNAYIASWPCQWLSPGEGLGVAGITVTGAPTTAYTLVATRLRL